jgi:hypothetical protein
MRNTYIRNNKNNVAFLPFKINKTFSRPKEYGFPPFLKEVHILIKRQLGENPQSFGYQDFPHLNAIKRDNYLRFS